MAVLVTKDKDKYNNEPTNDETLIIIKKNNEIQRPNNKLTVGLELVKMKNEMNDLLISDPFASKLHIQISKQNGSFVDTVPGISHFGEHMIFQGSEKYHF